MNNVPRFSIFNKYLPFFSERYSFEICPKNRVDGLVSFINDYWKKDHILSRSREFLDWQHFDKKNDRYNFILAIHKHTDEIHAINGYTLSSHYDHDINEPVFWGNIWKCKPDLDEPGLGMMANWLSYDLFYLTHIIHPN